MTDDDHVHEGKCLIQANEQEVTLTTDCVKCGRVVIGPIPTLHLRAVAHLINHIADRLGLPEGGFDEQFSEAIHASTPAEFEQARRHYEDLPIDGKGFSRPQSSSKGSLWGD